MRGVRQRLFMTLLACLPAMWAHAADKYDAGDIYSDGDIELSSEPADVSGKQSSASRKIVLHALFKGKAILVIDGKRRVLSSGQDTPEGVKLLATDTQREEAEIEVNGKREVLKLGMVASAFTRAQTASVTLYAETNGHYFTDGWINGVGVHFMVDTGATDIAMNSHVAKRIGLDYKRLGIPGFANTASGVVQTYNIKLRSVKVGDITLYNVNAGVIEGRFPAETLLGMSFLGQLEMQREGNKLELIQKF